jgi:hypothetical protein
VCECTNSYFNRGRISRGIGRKGRLESSQPTFFYRPTPPIFTLAQTMQFCIPNTPESFTSPALVILDVIREDVVGPLRGPSRTRHGPMEYVAEWLEGASGVYLG